MKKKIWFPWMHQLDIRHNPSYLHSVFLGLTAPFLNIWTLMIPLFVIPLLRAFWVVLRLVVLIPLVGITGGLCSNNQTLEEAYRDAIK